MDAVSAIRAQMIGQLIDALSRGAAQPAAATLALSRGQSVTAEVLGEIAGGRMALSIRNQPVVADMTALDLPTGARQPGARLALTVVEPGPTPRFALGAISAPPPQANARPLPRPEAVAVSPVAVRIEPAPAAPLAATRPAETPVRAALRDATAQAASRQGGAGALYASLSAVADQPTAGLPAPVRAIAHLLLDMRLDGTASIASDTLRTAVTAATAAAGGTTNVDAPLDTKTLLATLRALLPHAATITRLPEKEQPAGPPPEPPQRDSAPAAQKPQVSGIPPIADETTVAGALAREAEQALERGKLHGYAGLPDARAGHGEQRATQVIAFELPIALGPQTAMAGFRLERDRRDLEHDGPAQAGAPVDHWGIRFAIETDEIGAVHAHLRLAGPALSVSLWAAEPATHRAFVEAVPLLEAALRDAALDVGQIAVFAGRPAELRATGSGRLLDVMS
jgi:hypothetical protein